MIVAWGTPNVAGVYTVTVTGSITNSVGSKTATTNFVLGVYSCLTSTDTITITPSVLTPVNM